MSTENNQQPPAQPGEGVQPPTSEPGNPSQNQPPVTEPPAQNAPPTRVNPHVLRRIAEKKTKLGTPPAPPEGEPAATPYSPEDKVAMASAFQEMFGVDPSQLQGVMTTVQSQSERQLDTDVDSYVQQNPYLLPYKDTIASYYKHESRQGVPIESIAHEIMGAQMLQAMNQGQAGMEAMSQNFLQGVAVQQGQPDQGGTDWGTVGKDSLDAEKRKVRTGKS